MERDYTGGELVQFASNYPLELEGRVCHLVYVFPLFLKFGLVLQITPTQFLETINAINELLISAHSVRHSFIYNTLAVFTLQISQLFMTSHYEKVCDRKYVDVLECVVTRMNIGNASLGTLGEGFEY